MANCAIVLPEPEELWHGSLADMLAASMLYSEEERRHFLRREVDATRAKAFADRFHELLGWRPPAGALEWEAERRRVGMLPLSEPWTVFVPQQSGLRSEASLPSVFYDLSLDASQLLDQLLRSEAGVEFLCTGLYRADAAPFDDAGCRLSLLPHRREALEILLVDTVTTEVDELHPSLLHFFMRRWNASEVAEWFDEFADRSAQGSADFAIEPHSLEGRLRAFEFLSREERLDRPFHLNSALLRRRSFWLFGHPSLQPIPGFTREMRSAPSMMDWELELPLIDKSSVLAGYWMLAHLFCGNVGAARQTADVCLRHSGELIRLLAEKTLTLLESPEAANVSADVLCDIQETTLLCARPHQLEDAARQRREQLLATLAKKGSDQNPDLCPDFLWKI